jgi:DNA-binding response OmpR family regulator
MNERKPRILLIEDDGEMRQLLASVLRAESYEVVEVGNGTEGVVSIYDAAREGGGYPQPIDLIVSDIRLPGWTGLELLEMTRRRRMTVPVLLMTAFGAPETHAEASRLGAKAVLDKPFSLENFRATVAALLS